MNSTVLSYIKGHVVLTLRDAKKKAAEISAMKPSDLGSTLQKYQKFLAQMKEKAEELQQKMDQLKSIFVTAAGDTKSTIAKMADSIAELKDIKLNASKMAMMLAQMKSAFKDNPAAKSLLEEAEKTQKKFNELSAEKEQFLSDLTKKEVPVYLTTNNERFFRPFLTWVIRDIKKAARSVKGNKKPDILIKESKFMPGINNSAKKELRWARFIPMVNIPDMEGHLKNLYLVVAITFLAYGEEKGLISPIVFEDERGMRKPAISQYSIALTSGIKDPIELSSSLKVVASVQEAIQVMAYLSHQQNLAIFGTEIEGDVEGRMKKIADKARILNKPGVVVEKDPNGRNFIIVKIPKSLLPSDLNEYSFGQRATSRWEGDLFLDVCQYAGIPIDQRTRETLSVEKVYPEGDKMCFLFRVLPVFGHNLKSDEIKTTKKATPVLDPSFDDGLDDTFAGMDDMGINNMVNSWTNRRR